MKSVVLGIKLDSLLKAVTKFKKFSKQTNTEQEKAGAIQAFEYTYELCWKTMKRVMATKGVLVHTPRDSFREAALIGLIDDPELWFEFITLRNLTVHTYSEDDAEKVINQLAKFESLVDAFLVQLEKLNDSVR